MTTNNRVATELAKAHLVVAGIALLGWIAMALLANFQQLPQHWPQESEVISDVAFGGILLCGPAFLAAGIGLLKRRPWARLVAMGLGGVAGVLAVAGVALAC